MVFKITNLASFTFPTKYFVILLGLIILPPSFSNLSNLVSLSLTNVTFQGFEKNSLFNSSQSFLFICEKLEEEFPSCFQNMTRLTNIHLDRVRGVNPASIPFPTQFCNMIYLQYFTSIRNNFSGFEDILVF